MTNKQKIVVAGWVVMVFSILALAIFEQWFIDNWEVIKWPSLIVIALFSLFTGVDLRSGSAQGGENLNRIASNNPWVKLYIVVYSLGLTFYCFNGLFNGRDMGEVFGPFGMLAAILGMCLPVIVIQQIEDFRNADDKI